MWCHHGASGSSDFCKLGLQSGFAGKVCFFCTSGEELGKDLVGKEDGSEHSCEV
jgi:hypothetical protein